MKPFGKDKKTSEEGEKHEKVSCSKSTVNVNENVIIEILKKEDISTRACFKNILVQSMFCMFINHSKVCMEFSYYKCN